MDKRLFDELRDVWYELDQNPIEWTPEDLADRLLELGIEIPSSKVEQILGDFSHYFSQTFVPKGLISTVTEILKEQKAEKVFDPWAGSGAFLSSVLKFEFRQKVVRSSP